MQALVSGYGPGRQKPNVDKKLSNGSYLGRCQQSTGNSAFTRHDDSILGKDSHTSSSIIDSLDGIFDLQQGKGETFVVRKTREHHILRPKRNSLTIHSTYLMETAFRRKGRGGGIVTTSHNVLAVPEDE
jgi:hypothetical protein